MSSTQHRSVLALGSNMGDRLSFFIEARAKLSTYGCTLLKSASIYESEPVGLADRLFYNTALLIETFHGSETLLKIAKRIESELGRSFTSPRWSNRPIDIDIITYDNEVRNSSHLTLPHPEYSRRLFVLLPMKEVLPQWIDPISGIPLQELIHRFSQNHPNVVCTHW